MLRTTRLSMTACTLAILLATGCSQKEQAAPPPPEVGVVTIKPQDATVSTSLPGRVLAVESSEVRPQVNGVIKARLFKEGSIVQKGAVLYEIEDAPYRAALASALGNLATAQATIRSTRLQADRYQRLLAMKGVSQQEADDANAAAASARATVQARQADVMAARVNLGFTRIRAPITGRIGRALVTVGGLAQTGQAQPLATINKINEVYVDVTQSAGDLLNLRDAIQSGQVTRDASGAAKVQLILPNGQTYPIEGRLEFSEASVDDTSGSVTIRARFANPDGVLLPGMYVQAKLMQGVRRSAILAPQQGVTHDEHGDAVALVVGPDNVVQQRKLKLGAAQGDSWIVESGLKAGDRVIVEGLMNLHPGTKVTPAAPQQAPADTPGAQASGAAKD